MAALLQVAADNKSKLQLTQHTPLLCPGSLRAGRHLSKEHNRLVAVPGAQPGFAIPRNVGSVAVAGCNLVGHDAARRWPFTHPQQFTVLIFDTPLRNELSARTLIGRRFTQTPGMARTSGCTEVTVSQWFWDL